MQKNRKVTNSAKYHLNRSISNILFLDIKGYSSLNDDALYRLTSNAFISLQETINKRNYDYINTWGDAIVIASQDVKEITHIALDVRDFFLDFDWQKHGLPTLKARISLHHGTIWKGKDVFTNRGLISGGTVNLAARIEPIAEPGQIWATKDFAALLARDGQTLFRSEAIGSKELPKGSGIEELHVILRERESSPLEKGKEVSVTIVIKDNRVLLVRRIDGDKPMWQFPAGQVKAKADPTSTAVDAAREETDITCTIVKKISERRHPDTGVFCHYFHAIWESGEPSNKDAQENDTVEWVTPADALTRFTTNVEPAVKALLETLSRSE